MVLSQNSEYPRIFQVTGANQKARKLLSTDLVNTKEALKIYIFFCTTSFEPISLFIKRFN